MSMQPWNMLETEAAIIERLKFATQDASSGVEPWCRKIVTAQNMSGIKELKDFAQVAPAILVSYDGEIVIASTDTADEEEHRWHVVILVKNAADQRTSDQLNTAAGVYLARVKAALKGFVPPGTTGQLRRTTPAKPYFESGLAFYPLLYSVRVVISSQFGAATNRPSRINQPFLAPTVKRS